MTEIEKVCTTCTSSDVAIKQYCKRNGFINNKIIDEINMFFNMVDAYILQENMEVNSCISVM